MKASFTLCVVLFAGALSMGCVAQAGTDDTSSTEQGLTDEPGAAEQQQQAATVAERARLSPPSLTKVVRTGDKLEQQVQVKELEGTDPGGDSQDDGDGKEPDPHPWHNTTVATASH